ncbi:hypothetical protein RAS2_08030 [Phycisphaerae bacterium RAS2]|nr:hypothetical protein RAS2_08030 [Phycisphaerae bacterium RAS2]
MKPFLMRLLIPAIALFVVMGVMCGPMGDSNNGAPQPDPQGEDDPSPNGDNEGDSPDESSPPGAVQKLGELLLGGAPGNIALDLTHTLGYVAAGNRIRRFNPATRSWAPLTAPGGVFYGLDHDDDFLGQINTATGQITRIISYPESFPITPSSNAGFVVGMDYNPVSGKLYIMDIFALGRLATLFEFDPNTGERTQIGATGLEGTDGPLSMVFSLARDPATGLLYTVDVTDILWSIDPNTGTASLIGPLSPNPTEFSNVQGLTFSQVDGHLYGLNHTAPSQIVSINTSTGAAALVCELPLGRGGGSLASMPDGTLWGVNLIGVHDSVMFTDYLYRIDCSTNPATLLEFPTLELGVQFGPQTLFQGINSLCFAPNAAPDQTVPTFQSIDALAIDPVHGLMAAAGDGVYGFDPDFEYFPSGIGVAGLADFKRIVLNQGGDRAYVRDGLSGKVYEFEPGQTGVTNQIQYRPASGFYSIPRQPDSGIDAQTGALFLAGDFELYQVDLASGNSVLIDDGANDNPEGVIVDSARRRLHVNMQFGGPANCGAIRTYNLDTLQVINNLCGDGPQLFNMAFDPVRNRIAVICRVSTQFDMVVRIFDMDTYVEEPFSPISLPRAADNTNASSAFLEFDTVRNQLIVARPDTPARLEFYGLPD